MSHIRLSDTQLVILTAAAGRDDGTVLPVPKSLTIRGGAADKVFTSLLKRGLVEERTVAPGDTAWREADGHHVGLAITAAGLAAIGADPAASASESIGTKTRVPSKRAAKEPATTVRRDRPVGNIRAGTKQAFLLDLLKRQTGATIAEISDATGWQAHSVRGVISGAVKKKLGLEVTSEVEEGRGRVYRVASEAASAEEK